MPASCSYLIYTKDSKLRNGMFHRIGTSNHSEVAKLISSVFNAQIFQNGFVHCDPHPANVLIRKHPHKEGPQLVLLDHGLYKKLDGQFQEAYARLWKSILMADIPGIQSACKSLGVQQMVGDYSSELLIYSLVSKVKFNFSDNLTVLCAKYPLLAAMLTSRPFDEVVERSQTRSFDASPIIGASHRGGDKVVIRGYVQRYIKEIIYIPRQMLLIFKMNDCLRHVDYALGSPANTLVVAGRYASKRVFECDKREKGGLLDFFRSWLSYIHVILRINSYELCARLSFTN